ncbi:MAG: hypothetical protein RI988_4124 [Pseudomonadota bacterium]|jgi:hypothetical protein
MRRSAILLVMLFAMLWQSMAMARAGSTVNALADLQHAVLYWQEAGHFHADDGSYHLDDSSESMQHVAMDHLNTALGLVTLPSHDFPRSGLATPDGLHERLVPDPALDGLLRPPRLHA